MRAGTTILRICFAVTLLCNLFASAHMVMSEPPPINYKTNPHYNPSKGDSDYTAPLSPSGSNYPCRGHLKDLNTPEGAPVRDYSPGGTYELKIDGSAVHGGGSCQASLSYDGGASWSVIKSWIGNCPNANGGAQSFSFTVPTSAPSGTAIFAWTWFNKIGNREMYMNCAVVNIGGGGGRRIKQRQLGGPSVFIANVGNGCKTTEGTDVVFPNAGDQVEFGSSSSQAPPSGVCDGQTFVGGGPSGVNQPGPGWGDNGEYKGSGDSVFGNGNGNGLGGDPTQGCDYWREKGYICSRAAKPSKIELVLLLIAASAVALVQLLA